MPPETRPIPRFAAGLPDGGLPSGPWAELLRAELLRAADSLDDVGEIGDVVWFPDRSWGGRAYVPATARTSTGLELFGFVSFASGDGEPSDFRARADVTEEVAEEHPEWNIDLCDEVVGTWRGEKGASAQMTLVWGMPLVDGAAIATAELGHRITITVDQCPLIDNRFTLLAPDDYRGDTLAVHAFGPRGQLLARESLYDED